jgi:hypothetical protein
MADHAAKRRADIMPDAAQWAENDWADDGAENIPISDDLPRNDPLACADEEQRKLALVLDFGPDDLMFNDEGRLSPAQIDQLNQDLIHLYGPMIGACILIALVFSLIGLSNGAPLLVPGLLVLALAVLPMGLLKHERDRLAQSRVQRTTLRLGTLSLTARRLGLMHDTPLPVPGNKPIFDPGRKLYKVLRANQTYILYYTPVRTWRGYRLLSLVPTDDASEPEKPKRKPKRGRL